MFGKEFQQDCIADAAIDNGAGPHAGAHCAQGRFRLRDHAAGDGAVGDHGINIGSGQLGQDLSCGVPDPRDIGQKQQPVGLEGRRNCTGGGVTVDVIGLSVAALAQRRNHRDHVMLKEVVDHTGIDMGRVPDEAQFGISGFTSDHVGIFAREAHGFSAFGVDRLYDPFVDTA